MSRFAKPRNTVELDLHRRQERRGNAPSIAELFPGVESVRVSLSFTEEGAEREPRKEQHFYTPASLAFFEYKCPSWKCGLGGFDLGPLVERAVQSRSGRTTGTLKCSGWHDPEARTENCVMSVRYVVAVARSAAPD